MAFNEQESRRETLSGNTIGGAVKVTAARATDADVLTVHQCPEGHVDAIYVQAHNSHTTDVVLSLLLNPAGTATADLDAVRVDVEIPAQSSLWVLQGDSMRRSASGPAYTVAAYASAADSGRLSLTGYVITTSGGSIY